MKAPKEVYVRWMGIPVVSIIMSFLVKDHSHEQMSFLMNILISMFFTAVLWNGACLLIFGFRRIYPEIEATGKRLAITSLSIIVFLIIGADSIRLLLGLISFQDFIENPALIFEHAGLNMIAGFMVASVYEGVYFFEKWRESVQLNEELKNQQIRTQFEVLQNQMSPHFLFNSLNTLTTLIAENQNTAIEFTQTLSEVYRYILQNKEKELVTLKEELDFSKSYIYLLQIRYPENLNIHFNVDAKFESQSIAPLTLQMLIENSIKHNVVSKTSPLSIDIYIENDKAIIVKNNLQPKKTLEKSTKTGLANIRKRYQYFGFDDIDVITSQSNFMVAIPLIQIEMHK